MSERRALVLGAGNSQKQIVRVLDPDFPAVNSARTFSENFEVVHTIDIDPGAKPTWLWNLEDLNWPCPENFYDEVHAYECLEHLGQMGDYEFFFHLWMKIWMVLKPGGLVGASTPWWESVWAWQDPGHRRVYSPELLTYLDQDEYVRQVGVSAMTDYRAVFPPPFSFKFRGGGMNGEDPKRAGFAFALQKIEWRPDDQG